MFSKAAWSDSFEGLTYHGYLRLFQEQPIEARFDLDYPEIFPGYTFCTLITTLADLQLNLQADIISTICATFYLLNLFSAYVLLRRRNVLDWEQNNFSHAGSGISPKNLIQAVVKGPSESLEAIR